MSQNKRTSLTIERRLGLQCRALPAVEAENPELWVEGYAVRFDSPTVLFELDGQEYWEQIARGAFTDCRMEDVILNYDHQGKVVARTRNQTLQLQLDEDGLLIRARLDGTEEGRKLYEEIAGGYVDRMSFRFHIRKESYDNEQRMWTVERIKRLYDVSAVSIPAYDDTSLAARRGFVEEQLAEERQAVLAAEAALARQRAVLELRLKL